MKKTIILLFLILSALTSAQNFFPTKPGDAYQFEVIEMSEFPVFNTNTSYKKSFAEEYIFQNKSYVKIWDKFLRMDTTSNKLYILINGEEKLACDFNKSTGEMDTLYFGGGRAAYTYNGGNSNIFGQIRPQKEIIYSSPPFKTVYVFVFGVGFYEYQDTFQDPLNGQYNYETAISAIINNVIYNPFVLNIAPSLPTEVSPEVYNYSIPVNITTPYPGLVNYLAADVVIFKNGVQTYQNTYNGNLDYNYININLANSILTDADSVGIRVRCEDESIFSNKVSYPLSGYHFIPVVNEISWKLISPNVWGPYDQALKFFTKDIGYIFISNDIYYPDPNILMQFKSTNGGDSFGSADWLDRSSIGYIVTFSDSIAYCIYGGLKKTTNQGKDWFRTFTHSDDPSLTNFSFINSDTGWVSGTKYLNNHYIPKIYRTFDGGTNWNDYNTSLNEDFMLIDFAAVNEGYAVTETGKIYRSADGGETWQFTNTTIANQKEFNMFQDGKGWLTGNGIWRTEDGGINWTQQFAGNFVDAHFFNADKGWVIGTANGNNVLLYTNNGGADWNEIQVPEMGGDYLYIDFVDELHGWIYSTNKRLLKTTNGGVIFIEDENTFIKSPQYFLKQNYPNPFNPITKIRWQSLVSTWQTIKVYDVLGREVDTLVDEYKDVGNHEVEFNASQLPSGVYFYQLKTANHVETKKMIFIK